MSSNRRVLMASNGIGSGNKPISSYAIPQTLMRPFSSQKFDFVKPSSQKLERNLTTSDQQLMNQEDDEFDPYTSDNHTLIPYLYLYPFFNDNIGYVLLEPKTNELLAIDIGDYKASKPIISKLEQQHNT